MKFFVKKLILFLFVLCSTFCASAQVQFGVKAGFNISNLSTSGMTFASGASFSSKADFNGGVMASLPLFPSFYLQPELSYSGQGQSFSNPMANGTLNYDYLNLPVLFKYQHASGLFVETGPQIGFLLSAKEAASGHSTLDVTSGSQSIDFSWAFGFGYKLQAIPIGIDLRYNLGLTTIYKQSGVGTAKNSVFQFDLFYLFGGK
jgi:hypothetical protein